LLDIRGPGAQAVMAWQTLRGGFAVNGAYERMNVTIATCE
jgi:hypothetical protein